MFDYDVKVYPLANPAGKVLAFASLIIDGQIEVTGFKIIDGKFGKFVAAPNRQSTKTGDDGKPVSYDDVKFLGPKDDKNKNPLQQEIYNLMLEKYTSGNATTARAGAAQAQAKASPKKDVPEDSLW
jgi:DNA-binding cell septation regulator SpoVG